MDAISYLELLKPSYMSLGLERLEGVLKILPFEIPSNNIIVAGTNGKGSTCAYLSSILRKAGLKIGFFSSPHLIDLFERIRINDKPIDIDSLNKYTFLLKDLLEKNKKDLTFFEFLTILSLWYFKEEETDLNILEVGLGGRLDATNIANSILSMITSISFDHTNFLGKNLKSIAKEKAGIIKEKVPTIVAPQKKSVLEVLKEEAEKKSSSLIELSKEAKIKNKSLLLEGLSFELITKKNKYNIFTSHLGLYQIENSSLAILAAENLSETLKFPLTPEAVERGVASTNWLGRLKKYNLNGKGIYLDGAHNIGGIVALTNSIKKLKLNDLNIGFFAFKDKNPEKLIQKIVPFSKRLFIFSLNNERALKYEEWEILCKKIGLKNYEIIKGEDFEKSIFEKNIQLYTGSLYFIGEVLKCLRK